MFIEHSSSRNSNPRDTRETHQKVYSSIIGRRRFPPRRRHNPRHDLPGNPDLVFPRLKKVIFVHGCFWHGHGCARGNRVPVQNREYWVDKIKRNRQRDQNAARLLRKLGWKRKVIWECRLKNPEQVKSILDKFLRN
ncbi:MAG: very short patch repair endonuclease [Terracidiphilus sp.]